MLPPPNRVSEYRTPSKEEEPTLPADSQEGRTKVTLPRGQDQGQTSHPAPAPGPAEGYHPGHRPQAGEAVPMEATSYPQCPQDLRDAAGRVEV